MSVNTVATAGGLFAVLAFVHFVVDWIFQSHSEAMQKHDHAGIRARHCLVYTSPFVPLLWWLGCTWGEVAISAAVLFFSHFIEDTYLPVYWWAKYVRKIPHMRHRIEIEVEKQSHDVSMWTPHDNPSRYHDMWKASIAATPDGWRKTLMIDVYKGDITPENANVRLERRGFMEFADTPLGKILMVAVDQIVHLAFLFVPVYFLLGHR